MAKIAITPETVSEASGLVNDVVQAATDTTVQNRWTSKVLLGAIAAVVVFAVQIIAGVDLTDTAAKVVDLVLVAVAIFGVINNPTNKKKI